MEHSGKVHVDLRKIRRGERLRIERQLTTKKRER